MRHSEKTEDDQPDEMTGRRRVSLGASIFWVALTTLIGMTVYQLLKLLIHPDISLLQSNIITVVFTTTVASTAAYFGMRKYQAQHEQLIQEITDHKRLDRELRDKNERLGIEIAERKHVEDALRAHLSFSQTLMDTVPAPIFYKDINGFYLG
ncbi:MAG: hypothetical protein HQK57_13670, partial [Deltaproteobacteria bacterium]|nr:hypothetical protein [Deltaproteobacteria bacterium]